MTSVLIFHIIVALGSVFCTAYLYLRPSHAKLRISYVLVALTVGTGTYLITNMSGNILGVCLFGLGFIASVLAGILVAQKKLVREEVNL